MNKYIYRAKLDRVVDGDTVDALIDVGFDIWFKKRIRFKGVDTWESRTKELLEKISSKSGYFRIRSYGTGKYGRVLADVYIQDIDGNHIWVNKTLIDEGHAYVYDGGTKKVFTS